MFSMRTIWRMLLALILAMVVAIVLPFFRPQPATANLSIEPYLYSGQFSQGKTMLLERLKQQPRDDQARFGLGLMELMEGLERLMQALYRHGARDTDVRNLVPILRLPVPVNPQPTALTYETSRQILQQWIDDLATVQATLEPIQDTQVKLPLRLGSIRLDVNGDGRVATEESFWKIFERIMGTPIPQQVAQAFTIGFDYGDVLWLRGYCHLLMALGETALGYDGSALFNATAHLFFTNPTTPYPFLQEGKKVFTWGSDVDIADLIALIHLVRLPVAEPARLSQALRQVQTTLDLSRKSWQAILAETDNDHEWLPNPRQQAVMPDFSVTQPMIDSWLAFLDEADTLLMGQKLVPFWRGQAGLGVNLNRVFIQPTAFDLVLWVQGSAAAPYLEKGTLTDEDFWRQLMEVFRGQFFLFAAWFN